LSTVDVDVDVVLFLFIDYEQQLQQQQHDALSSVCKPSLTVEHIQTSRSL